MKPIRQEPSGVRYCRIVLLRDLMALSGLTKRAGPFAALSVSRTSVFAELRDYLEVARCTRTIITVSKYFSCGAFIRFFPGHSLF